MNGRDSVCVLIPTLNEARTIGNIISEFMALGYDNIHVIDGHSTDGTVDIARKAGAKVIIQEGSGKGRAIQQAFEYITSDYIVMIDGDGTYLPEEVERLLMPLFRNEADHVIGNRFGGRRHDAFTGLNLLGNRLLNKLFGFAYGVWLSDILTGYRSFTGSAVKSLELKKTGFEIETEITVESIKKDLRIAEVPVTYLARSKGTATKLHPIRDGFRIGRTIYMLAKMYNPLFYFSVIGVLLLTGGIITGIFVVSEWLKGIDHIPLTILATLLIISGFQMFVFAMMGDIIVNLHRELMREIKKK